VLEQVVFVFQAEACKTNTT